MRITPQNARELQAKAVDARIRNKELREQAQQAGSQLTGGYAPTDNSFSFTRARVIERLIDKLIKQIAATDDAKEQQAKAMALDRLYGTWADMTGHERRGVSKTRKRKAQDPLHDLQLEPVAQ